MSNEEALMIIIALSCYSTMATALISAMFISYSKRTSQYRNVINELASRLHDKMADDARKELEANQVIVN